MHQRERVREKNIDLTIANHAFGATREEFEDLRHELRENMRRLRQGDRPSPEEKA